jgi:hypothetical protein
MKRPRRRSASLRPALAFIAGGEKMSAMRKAILTATLTAALAAPALAATYPVSGKWGQSASSTKGAIECHGRRVISFNGNRRTDSTGGVRAFRNRSVTADGPSQYRIVDEFSNAQMSDARTTYTMRVIDDDNIVLQLQPGGTVRLQRCK